MFLRVVRAAGAGRPSRAANAPRPWTACACGLRSLSKPSPTGPCGVREKTGAAAARVLARNHRHRYCVGL
jgi:hypothetical protein